MISDDEIIRDFGVKLKAARIKRKMTQEQLGEAIGADKSRISDYENGRRKCSITTAFRLAKALDVSLGYLMDKQTFDFKRGQSQKDRLCLILDCIGHSITEWGFQAYEDANFGDYSLMHSIGLSEDSFGTALRNFENLKNGAAQFGTNIDQEIYQIANDCAEDLLNSKTFVDRIAKK